MKNYREALGHLQRALDAAMAEGDLLLIANISHPIDLVSEELMRRQAGRFEQDPILVLGPKL